MKKLIAAGVAGAILLVVGGSVGVRQTLEPSSCQKPLVLFESAQSKAVVATDDYIDANIAELYEHPATVNWITASVGQLSPGRITAVLALGETETDIFGGYEFVEGGMPRLYNVVLERECSGDDWKVVKFELVKGEPAEPNSGQAPKPAASS